MPKTSAVAPAPCLPSYERLRQRLGARDWVASGSVVERNKPGQGGPRYQWTRRVEGKTLTVALSKEQFAWLKIAIQNQRQTRKIIAQMEKLSLQHMWKSLPGIARRKSLSPRAWV